jgi:hypothetical protein
MEEYYEIQKVFGSLTGVSSMSSFVTLLRFNALFVYLYNLFLQFDLYEDLC